MFALEKDMDNSKKGSQVRSVENVNAQGLKFNSQDLTRSTKIDKNASKMGGAGLSAAGRTAQSKRGNGYENKALATASNYSEYQKATAQQGGVTKKVSSQSKHSSSSHALFGGASALTSKVTTSTTISKYRPTNPKETAESSKNELKGASSPGNKQHSDKEKQEAASPHHELNKQPNTMAGLYKTGSAAVLTQKHTLGAATGNGAKKPGVATSPFSTTATGKLGQTQGSKAWTGSAGSQKHTTVYKQHPLTDRSPVPDPDYEENPEPVSINVYGMMNGAAGKDIRSLNDGAKPKK